MSMLEIAVEELKSLPPEKLQSAAGYIHQLKLLETGSATTTLHETFGCLNQSEADSMAQAIATHCERVDANQW